MGITLSAINVRDLVIHENGLFCCPSWTQSWEKKVRKCTWKYLPKRVTHLVLFSFLLVAFFSPDSSKFLKKFIVSYYKAICIFYCNFTSTKTDKKCRLGILNSVFVYIKFKLIQHVLRIVALVWVKLLCFSRKKVN